MKYVSKKAELCLVMVPTDRTMDEHRRVQVIPGKRVEFFAGKYETKDPEIIEFMHNHPLRNLKFYEITEKDDQAVELAKRTIGPQICTGALSTNTASDSEKIEEIVNAKEIRSLPDRPEPGTRPDQTTAISPEFIKVIDDRINAAMETIISLLKQDTVKGEKIMSGKPTKSFKCPYCEEVFSSGFQVGTHKKEKHASLLVKSTPEGVSK